MMKAHGIFTSSFMALSEFKSSFECVTVQRYQFFSQFRQPDESISAFVAELRSLAKDCEFGAVLENNLRDRLVCGVAEPSIQKRLLTEHNHDRFGIVESRHHSY